jgi:NOL1/NOP2/fmu family ribosome biogenesis protein
LSLAWLSPEETAAVALYLEERFGISAPVLASFRLFRRGDHICALHEDAAAVAEVLQPVQAGLKLLKVTGSGGFKPSTRGVQVFGQRASKNVTDLSGEELRAILQGRSLPRPGARGFVLLRALGCVIGVGLAREDQLVSQLPRGLTENLDPRRIRSERTEAARQTPA